MSVLEQAWWQGVAGLVQIFAAGWWQGVAGLAQIVAAGLTIYAMQQTRQALRLAEQERKAAEESRHEAVAADWDIVTEAHTFSVGPGQSELSATIRNTGFGPARKVLLSFHSRNGNEPISCGGSTGSGSTTTVPVDQNYKITMRWDTTKPLDGVLLVTCQTRYGREYTERFHVRAWLGAQGEHLAELRPFAGPVDVERAEAPVEKH